METLRQTYRTLIGLGVLALLGIPFTFGQNPKALFPQRIFEDSTIRVSYLLPISAKECIEQGTVGDNKQMLSFLEFFQGGELALQYWKEKGFSIEAQLIDTKAPESEFQNNRTQLEKSDIWIGPVYAEEFIPYANLARANQKTIVYPLSQLGEVWKNNPFVYQVASDNIELWKNMIHHEVYTSEDADVLVFIQPNNWGEYASYLPHILNCGDSLAYSPHTGHWQKIPDYKTLLSHSHHPPIHARLIVYEPGKNPLTSRNNLASILNSDHAHKFVILSQDEAFLSDLLENLSFLGTDDRYRIQVYGMPRWNKFESLNSNWFYQLNAHIPSSYFAQYESPLAQRFIKDFMDKHAMDPSPYALQGFDVTNYFIQKQLGIQENMFIPIQSKYQFEQIDRGGFRNTTGYILEYTKNYEVIAR